MRTTAIFDIGKTNKKFMLFDPELREVYHVYEKLPETRDEDGFPCEDVERLRQWVLTTFERALDRREFTIEALNFSAYGASFVHLDDRGRVVAPLYNYLKPLPEEVLRTFYEKHGDPLQLSTATASPALGMLNSGLQLFWLKYARPKVFQKIHRSLHLPQYLSYLFTEQASSDPTSIGCHTLLWDFGRKDYHPWVYEEGLDRLFPPVTSSREGSEIRSGQEKILVGPGLHDSSAALLPYRLMSEEPFLLLSTGTWSIALNPFNEEPLSSAELQRDCLSYLTPGGEAVKASRLFLGREYQLWTQRLAEHFGLAKNTHRLVQPDPHLLRKLREFPRRCFRLYHLPNEEVPEGPTDLSRFSSFELAFHKFMEELTAIQVDQVRLALGSSAVRRIYIDGGFAQNRLFIHFLREALPEKELIAATTPFGSAIGAAVALRKDPERTGKVLRRHFEGRRISSPAGQKGTA